MYPAGVTHVGLTTVDEASSGSCAVSVDGFVWYSLPRGPLPPTDFTVTNCARAASLDASIRPERPAWSQPTGATKALFVATSLQEEYSLGGMLMIESLAENAGVPVTWMIGNPKYLMDDAAYYNAEHALHADDVEVEDSTSLTALARQALPWYAPYVSVQGAGHERNIPSSIALGDGGFWGITWNSHGTDDTSDEGAPWGTYCADESSYKRPSPSGDCSLVSFEWTARDLTRAYLTDTNADGYSAEAAFSTDPDDVLERGGFDAAAGAAYVRAMVDAYAAAGVSQPLVMMSQQETHDQAMSAGNETVLGALYAQAIHDGMKPETLRSALAAARSFSAAPRAIAFPYIDGGRVTPYDGVTFTPATIDFHDDAAGMTFLSGHTLPSRVFEYVQDPISAFDRTLIETTPQSAAYPQLVGVAVKNGAISFSFDSPQALHFGVAIWSDPASAILSGPGVVAAGHAGSVVAFDLPAGRSTRTVACGGCTSTMFIFSH